MGIGNNFPTYKPGSPNPEYSAPIRMKPTNLTGWDWWKAALTGNLPTGDTNGMTGVRGADPASFKVRASPTRIDGPTNPWLEKWSKFIQNPFASLPGLFNQAAGVQQPYYQVRPGDRSMDTVARDLNLPLQQFVDINGMKTLPPAGSYLALPGSGGGRPNIGTGANPQSKWEGFKEFLNQGPSFTSAVNALLSGQGQGSTEFQAGGSVALPSDRTRFGADYAAQQQLNLTVNALDQFNRTMALTGTADPKILPNVINLRTQEAMGMDYTQMIALGYTYSDGSWKKGATGSTPPGGQGVGYGYGTTSDGRPLDRFGKPIGVARNAKGNIIRRRSPAVSSPPVPPDNAAGTPSSVLSLRQGSG